MVFILSRKILSLIAFSKKQSYLFFKENKKMKIFSGQVFEVKTDTSRSEFLGELRKFGFFSGVEFGYRDANQSIFYVREVGMLERLGKMFHSVFSKDIYHASGDALLHLSQKNLALAGVLGRSVFDAQEKLVSARELNDRLSLGEKKLKRTEDSVLAVPSEGKMIVTDASSEDFRQAHEVDLTSALTEENFREACNSALSEAKKVSPEEILIVKLGADYDNDEASNEAINKLFLVIDDYHQSYPSSRLMITTDGDRLLYERLLNLKLQHDAKKFLQPEQSDLGPMDLLMIPARGDELVKLDPIDEERLVKLTTRFNNVMMWITNYPAMIQSDLSIVDESALRRAAKTPDDKPVAASKLIWSVSEHEGSIEVGQAFAKEKKAAADNTNLRAARFPAIDLPVKRLIVVDPPRGQWTKGSPQYGDKVDRVKNFYLQELRKEQGRVVIQSPTQDYVCDGLLNAVDELRKENKGPKEIIIAVPSSYSSVVKLFS